MSDHCILEMLELCPVSFYAYISCQPFTGNWLISSLQVWSPNDDSCCSDIESSVYKKSRVNVGPNGQTSFIFLFRIKPTSNNCVYWMSAAFDLTSDRIWLCEVQLEYCRKHCWMDGPHAAQRMYLRSLCLIQTWISYRSIIMEAQDFDVGWEMIHSAILYL